MAIKIAQKKIEMRYNKKPVWPICANCKYYSSQKTLRSTFGLYTEVTQKRCTLGGFAVNKTATCKCHVFKEALKN